MDASNDRFARLAALKQARALPQKPPDLRLPDEEDPVSRLLGGGIASNRYGEHLAIRNWFSTPEFVEPSRVALQLLTSRPAQHSRRSRSSARRNVCAALADPHRWLFLDTETTGLAGGTGTYAFLVGLAWWDAGGLQVEQLFLRDFSEEHSLLHELAARLDEHPVLVTFNGKCFDWPLLENRFTMTRVIRVPQLAAHLDLLHPARALWRLRLGSVRLVELERQVLDSALLGWRREGDISSALIPQYYFDYLRGGTAQPLTSVVKHNQMDLRGLAALFGKINSLLDAGESAFAETDSLDLFGLSKFLQRRGERDLAHAACSHALSAGLPTEFRGSATWELALMAKRRGDLAQAEALWLELVASPQDCLMACEQLAIHYERHVRDFCRALEYTELAIKQIYRQFGRSRDHYASARVARRRQKLLCRRERLRHRIAKGKAASVPLLVQAAVAFSRPGNRAR